MYTLKLLLIVSMNAILICNLSVLLIEYSLTLLTFTPLLWNCEILYEDMKEIYLLWIDLAECNEYN